MKVGRQNGRGFTLVEITIVVAIIGLLAAIAIPNFVRARDTEQKNACINNLRQIAAATQEWATENRMQDTSEAGIDDIQNYMRDNLFPHCPSGGTYGSKAGRGRTTVGGFSVSTDPTCTLSRKLGHKLPTP